MCRLDSLPPLGEPTALLFACLASGLLVPLPEDVALLVAGWEVRTGSLDPALALAAGVVGTLGRDAVAFGLGRALGPRIERHPLVRRLIGEGRIARAHALFGRHGARMLFWTRFVVGLRAPLYFVGGSLDFPLRRFVWLDLVGLFVSVPLTLAIGAWAGAGAATAVASAVAHQRALLALTACAGLLWLLAKRRRREAELHDQGGEHR